jgi:glutamine amidotransferase-like uncharacterized protein
VLIYSGEGSWGSEVESLEAILYSHGTTYQSVNASELDQLSLDQLSAYALIIFPGGDAPTVARNLSRETHARLRAAVQISGISYLGFCAGAWLAVSPAPAPGQDVSYGLGVVDGPIQSPNYLSKQGLEFAIVRAQFPGGRERELLWYGGPITPDLPNGVIAKYPDGTPAITQIHSGNGFVIVSGLHPTATGPILDVLGLSAPEAIAPDFAWALLDSAIRQKELPAF